MDIGKSFSYVFEDPKWMMKILIGGIVLFIPIVNFAVIGYMLTTIKNVADGQANPLPEWGEFGAHFMKGLYGFVGALIYFAPMILLYCCMFVLTFVASAGAGAAGSRNGGDAIASAVGLVTICIQCIAGLYALIAGITVYAPLTRFAMSANQLSIFWDFRNNFNFIKNNMGNYVMALLIAIVASFIAQFGIILCVVGVLFTSFWANMVSAYNFGTLWRTAQSQGTAPSV